MGRKVGVQIVVIVEDRLLERFIRHALTALGYDGHKIRVLSDYPKDGSGSGKKYVEQKFREEVVSYRQKARENRALLLGTDADEDDVVDRQGELDAQLKDITQGPRDADERIVYWIPKWHVETWGLHLTGTPVVETQKYKSKVADVDWKQAGGKFAKEYSDSLQSHITTLDSLELAYLESRRLQF